MRLRRHLFTRSCVGALLLALLPGASSTARPAASGDVAEALRAFDQLSEQIAPLALADPFHETELERQGALDPSEFVYSEPMGDLDRDGFDDIGALHYRFDGSGASTGGLTLHALDGRSGKAMFDHSTSFTNGGAYVLPAAVGPAEGRGIIIISISSSTLDNTVTVDVEALNGKGKSLFKHTFAPSPDDQHQVVSIGLLNALEGEAIEVLITEAQGVTILDQVSLAESRVSLIDGRDGTISEHLPEPANENKVPVAFPVGDISGDGLDDYAFIKKDSDGGALTARAGTTGALLWSNAAAPSSPQGSGLPFEDVTGDGREDFLLNTAGEKPEALLIDGATGSVLWRKQGAGSAIPLGNADRKGAPEALLLKVSKATVIFTAVKTSGDLAYKRVIDAPAGGVGAIINELGDVDNDKVRDFLVTQLIVRGESLEQRYFQIRGRDGKTIDDASVYPLLRGIEKNGDDLARLTFDGLSIYIEAIDGKTGRRLWSTPAKTSRSLAFPTSARGARLDGDKCGDIVSTVSDGQSSYSTLALSGANGKMLWSKSITGSGEIRTGPARGKARC